VNQKYFYPLLVALAVAALSAGVLARQWLAPAVAAPAAATAAPAEPVLKDLDGKVRTLAEWRGKVVVLNFWATWCQPCRQEMPEFVRLQEELNGQGLQFVGVAIDEADAVKDYLKQTPVNYPILVGDERAPEWAEQLGNKASVLPFSVVFDREGKLVKPHVGVLRRETLLDIVRPLLSPPVSSAQR
jgi:thiol-disulfide isomerase/thioredoxin